MLVLHSTCSEDEQAHRICPQHKCPSLIYGYKVAAVALTHGRNWPVHCVPRPSCLVHVLLLIISVSVQLTPVWLLGHLSHVLPPAADHVFAGLFVVIFSVFAGQKLTQNIKDDIGDKSVFTCVLDYVFHFVSTVTSVVRKIRSGAHFIHVCYVAARYATTCAQRWAGIRSGL